MRQADLPAPAPDSVVRDVGDAFAEYLGRRYPGTRWVPVEGDDVGDEGGAVRRCLVAPEELNALRDRLAPLGSLADCDADEHEAE